MNAEMTTLDLETFIEARDFASLREEIRNWPAGDLAELMEPLSAEKEAVVFRLLPRDQAAQIFSYLPIERQQELLKAMAHEEVVNILNAMSDDDRTEFLEELPAQVTQRLLNLLSPQERQLASQFLGYPENSCRALDDSPLCARQTALDGCPCSRSYPPLWAGLRNDEHDLCDR